ncbi:MAG: hypothetical protein KDC10_11360 [Calditrichaeota bacterium]|nr:hypothetical protein [Calditrichota bacterium]MCB9474364.1 hypothetical protein [Candidatus Delongbacteria bacterium]
MPPLSVLALLCLLLPRTARAELTPILLGSLSAPSNNVQMAVNDTHFAMATDDSVRVYTNESGGALTWQYGLPASYARYVGLFDDWMAVVDFPDQGSVRIRMHDVWSGAVTDSLRLASDLISWAVSCNDRLTVCSNYGDLRIYQVVGEGQLDLLATLEDLDLPPFGLGIAGPELIAFYSSVYGPVVLDVSDPQNPVSLLGVQVYDYIDAMGFGEHGLYVSGLAESPPSIGVKLLVRSGTVYEFHSSHPWSSTAGTILAEGDLVVVPGVVFTPIQFHAGVFRVAEDGTLSQEAIVNNGGTIDNMLLHQGILYLRDRTHSSLQLYALFGAPRLEYHLLPNQKLELSWQPVPGAHHYCIYQRMSLDQPRVQIDQTLDTRVRLPRCIGQRLYDVVAVSTP